MVFKDNIRIPLHIFRWLWLSVVRRESSCGSTPPTFFAMATIFSVAGTQQPGVSIIIFVNKIMQQDNCHFGFLYNQVCTYIKLLLLTTIYLYMARFRVS